LGVPVRGRATKPERAQRLLEAADIFHRAAKPPVHL